MAKPTTLPRFATDVGVTVEPTESKKDTGWFESEKPPAQLMNWLFKWIYSWCLYLNGLTGELLTWTVKQTFTSGSVTDEAVEVNGGGVQVNSNPSISDQPSINTVHAPNIEKAWCCIGVTLGTPAAPAGYNIQSVSVTATYIQVTFRNPFTDVNYVPFAQHGMNTAFVANAVAIDASTCRIYLRDYAGAIQDPTVGTWVVAFRATGNQI